MRKTAPRDVINASVNQTMSRFVITSGTTLLVAIAVFVFGGPLLHGFSLAPIDGILVGTYSSIYVASTIALDLGVSRLDVALIDKETGKPIARRDPGFSESRCAEEPGIVSVTLHLDRER